MINWSREGQKVKDGEREGQHRLPSFKILRMLKKEDGKVTITCDKCGFEETASELRYNDAFFLSGWGLFPNARKYIHQCFKCMPKRYKMATKWAQKTFPPNQPPQQS